MTKKGKKVKVNVVTHYLEDDKKFEGVYRFVTVEVDGEIRRIDEYCYGRGQDRADGYVDALYDWCDWQIELNWKNVADAKVPKKTKEKLSKPLEYTPKKR